MNLENGAGYTNAPSGWQEWVFIFILCATQLFTQGSLGYILMTLAEVSKTFHQSGHEKAAEMSWHLAAYSLTIGSFILVTGRLGDMYGSKNILVIGWIWFAVWSIICGCSAFTGSAIFFDVCRAFQGIGPALLLPNALAIAGRTYPPGPKKNIVFCLIAMCAPLGCAIGGLIGAALAQYVWWPWAVWMYGIGCFAISIAAYWVVPYHRPVQLDGRPLQFDWLGALYGIGGLVLLNVSWNQAPIDGWSTPYVYILLILGLVLLVLFVWQEKRTAQPIADISVFNKRVVGLLFITALGWSGFGVWLYYIFQFIRTLRGVSSLESAIQFLALAVSGLLAPLFTAWAIPKTSSLWLMIIASFAFFVGSLLQALAPVEQSYWYNTFWSFVIMPWGSDISFPASTLFVSDAVPVEHQGISASLVNTVINYSMAIGLGIAGTVEVEGPRNDNILDGYRAALYTAVGLTGLGLVCSLLFAVLDRHREKQVVEVDVTEELGMTMNLERKPEV